MIRNAGCCLAVATPGIPWGEPWDSTADAAWPGTTDGELMRAVVHDRYGPPDVLRREEVERPVPKDDEVLVKI